MGPERAPVWFIGSGPQAWRRLESELSDGVQMVDCSVTPGESVREAMAIPWWTVVKIMSRSNLAVAAGFFLLGLYLVGSAFESAGGHGPAAGARVFPSGPRAR